MNEFTVGDRVKVISIESKVSTPLKLGMRGTVKLVSEYMTGIEFDDYMGGHNGSWNGKNGYCWYVPLKQLAKIDESEGKK